MQILKLIKLFISSKILCLKDVVIVQQKCQIYGVNTKLRLDSFKKRRDDFNNIENNQINYGKLKKLNCKVKPTFVENLFIKMF